MLRRPSALVWLTGLALMWPPSAVAHEKKRSGSIDVTIGWGEEPAFSGVRNAVDVELADAHGAPVTDGRASLAVEISFGDERITRPLVPAAAPGKYLAWLVPTRAGTYTFHVTGRVKGTTIDVTSTCSEKTFACVIDASEIQFPVRDPSAGQLADGVKRALPRADRAVAAADRARTVAFTALAAAVVALIVALGTGLRKGARG